jgi:hypothetical protein
VDKLRKLFVSPARMYGVSIVCFLVFFFVGIPVLNWGNNVQLPFSHALIAFAIFMVVLFITSIFTTVVYWAWFKKYWYVNIMIGFGSGYFIDMYLLSGTLGID